MKYLFVVALFLTSVTAKAEETAFAEGPIASASYSIPSGLPFSDPALSENDLYIESKTRVQAVAEKASLSFSAGQNSDPVYSPARSGNRFELSPAGAWLFGSIVVGLLAMWSNRLNSHR